MGRRRFMPPFEVDIAGLGKGGTGVGIAPDGAPVKVRFAPPGSRLSVAAAGKRKGQWSARRRAMVRPPARWAEPPCEVFGLCGGCALQELRLDAQHEAKAAYGLALVEAALAQAGRTLPDDVRRHPVRGVDQPYGYRNKVELSFGPSRYMSERDLAAGVPIDGRFLGFHAPGRWDRVVDTRRCWLVSDALNTLITATRSTTLHAAAPPPYDPRSHEGFWRYLVLRQGMATGQALAVLYTAPAADGQQDAVSAWAAAMLDADLGDVDLVGALWVENAGLGDVAQGQVRRVWGADALEERVLGRTFRLAASSFFQTSTSGAEVLYRTVAEAVGEAGGTLLDLYCGTGAIGVVLAERFDRVVGIEERPEAVADARANAERNGIVDAQWRVGRVEDALDVLHAVTGRRTVVVDPPRAGLHPTVARHLSAAEAEVMVYVACNPASLGRDAAVLMDGGWRPTDLWTVDLFPQTGHVEMVARLER